MNVIKTDAASVKLAADNPARFGAKVDCEKHTIRHRSAPAAWKSIKECSGCGERRRCSSA
jgi:hypothetical protein